MNENGGDEWCGEPTDGAAWYEGDGEGFEGDWEEGDDEVIADLEEGGSSWEDESESLE